MKREKVTDCYFKAIEIRIAEIDRLAEDYLNKFEFIPNPDIINRLFDIATNLFEKSGKNWNAIPEWAANMLDGWIPYAPSKNGSLYYALGWSCLSADAHLRNLLERVEGREINELDFPVLAEKEVVNQLCGLTENKP
jgi:hypothetical protein